MRRYHYTAKDFNGKKIKAYIDAPNKELAYNYLINRNLSIISIKESKALFKKLKDIELGKIINDDELIRFLKNLSILLESGLRLHDAIEVICLQTEKAPVRSIYFDIFFRLLEGDRLSDILNEDQKNFPKILVNMIRTGEETSNLVNVLSTSASYFENKKEIKSKILDIFLVPSLYFVAIIGISIFVTLTVIPIYADIFDSVDAEIPLIMKLFLDISDFVKNYLIFIIIISVLLVILTYLLLVINPKSRKKFDYFKLKIPVVKTLYRLYYQAFIAKTLHLMASNRLNLFDSIILLIPTITNGVYRDVLTSLSKSLYEGQSIVASLYSNKSLDEIFIKMLAIGERSGNLDMAFKNLDKYYDRTVLSELVTIKKKLNPALMFMIYLFAGILVAVVMIPTLSLIPQV